MKVLACMEVSDRSTEKIVDCVQVVLANAECESLNEFVNLYGEMVSFYLSNKLKDNYPDELYLTCLDFFELIETACSPIDKGDLPKEFKWL